MIIMVYTFLQMLPPSVLSNDPDSTLSEVESVVDEAAKSAPNLENMFSFWNFFWALVIILIGWLVMKMIASVLNLLAERSAKNRFTIKSTIPLVRLFGWVLVFYIIIAGVFHPNYETFIAALASAGIAVGFAAQDMLKNIFGGVIILFDRPFVVGDKIEVGEYYGEVVSIGLRSTRIVTPDDSLVTIPNAELNINQISNNNSGEANCQVVAEIYLPIDVDTQKVREVAMEAAKTSRYIYLNKPVAIHFYNEVKQRRSYLKMRVKAYVLDIRAEFDFQSDLTEKVLSSILRNGLVRRESLD